MINLDEIEVRANAATAGPWYREGGHPPGVITGAPASKLSEARSFRSDSGEAKGHYAGVVTPSRTTPKENWLQDWVDLDFIAHSRMDVPEMVAELREARALLEYLHGQTLGDRLTLGLCDDEMFGCYLRVGVLRQIAKFLGRVQAVPRPDVGPTMVRGKKAGER